jgi:ABC-type polysaccharide/polyol phosphate export permease
MLKNSTHRSGARLAIAICPTSLPSATEYDRRPVEKFTACRHRMPLRIAVEWSAAALGRNLAAGFRDLLTGAHCWRLWYLIGSAEMRRRFVRSRFGLLWIMLSSALSVSVIGLTSSLLWKQPVQEILPFVATGMTVCQFLTAVLNDATTAFSQYRHDFLNQYMPSSTIIYSVLYKNVATFLLNMIFPIVIIAFLGHPFTSKSLLSIVGLSLVITWCLFIGYAVAIVCARFRDVAQLVSSALQVGCFITPVIWEPESLPPQAHYFVSYNPFAHLLAVIRDPLLGQPLPGAAWLTASAIVLATLGGQRAL